MANLDTEEWIEERKKSQKQFFKTRKLSAIISKAEKPILEAERTILKTEREIEKTEKEVEKRILEVEDTIFKIWKKLDLIESEIKKKSTADILHLWKTLSGSEKVRFLLYLGIPRHYAHQYAKGK